VRRVAVVLLVAGAVAGVAAVADATLSPRALRTSILSAAKAQHSVHYVTKQVVGNSLTTLVGDVEAADGVQHVTLKFGKKSGKLTIVVVDQTAAYVQGDATGLHEALGLTNAQATTYAGQWISIPKGDKLYGGVAEDVTLGSAIQIITPRGRLKAFKARDHGVRVVGVRGTSGTGKKKELRVLVARAHGKLPLEEDEFAPGEEYISRTMFSKWGEAVQAQAPASSTPISTVRGG
jgi:hypothetical protein